MNAHASTAAAEAFLKTRLICVAVIDNTADAVPLAEALLAGGLNVIEVTFRTAAAAQAIALIRSALPDMRVGAGTVLTADQARQAVDAGAQFGVSPGLNAGGQTDILAGNDVLGRDPAPNVVKQLRVKYTLDGNRSKSLWQRTKCHLARRRGHTPAPVWQMMAAGL